MIKHKFLKKFLALFAVFGIISGAYGLNAIQNIEDEYFTFEKNKPVVNTSYPVTTQVTQETEDGYHMTVGLLGIPVKEVNVQVLENKKVIAGGQPFGVKYYTDGAVVVGCADVKTAEGNKNPAGGAGIRIGDVINEINGQTISSNEQLTKIIADSNGQPLHIKATRNALTFTADLTPVQDTSGSYKIGLWVRDSTAGIGTITYYDAENKTFAALGHSISDVDTGQIMPLQKGEILKSSITGIHRGEAGTPGELQGVFEQQPIGTLYGNEKEGIFGNLSDHFTCTGKEVEIGLKQNVKEGKASILCTIDESGVQEFEINIIKINRNAEQTTKNMIIEVTDSTLLEKTGGIVQGMSGSPILQDGKLIGAVTHVLIDNPKQGYAIFIENMLAH